MKKILKKLKRKIIENRDFNSLSRKFYTIIYKELLYNTTVKEKNSRILKARDIINLYEPNNTYNSFKRKKIIKEMLYYMDIYLSKLVEYYMFDFKSMNEEEISHYITAGQGKRYLRYLNPKDKTDKFTKDKYETYKTFKKYFKREVIFISKDKDYKIFEDFCVRHRVFVKKPYSSKCGYGIELIDSTNKDLKKLFKKLIKENELFILEEKIEQAAEMLKLHPSSVNCVRILTYLDDNDKLIIHQPFLKVGQNNSFVDNGGAGGILAAINPLDGRVISDGVDELGNEYKVHPNSKIKFKGFKIPKWDELIKIMTTVSKIRPEGRYLGWDVAYSNKGWVIVECNNRTAFVGQQLPLRKGIKEEFEKMIHWDAVPNKEQYNKTTTKYKRTLDDE